MTTRPHAKSSTKNGIVSPTDPVFRPYVTALGQLALAWNGLHESLALLYCTIMLSGQKRQPVNQHLAVWHALKSDRAQREILKAAAESNLFGALPIKFEKDVDWIFERANVLEDARNDALHSPLLGYHVEDQIIIVPSTGLGHVRAQKLAKRDLLAEFRWGRDSALLLARFALSVNGGLRDLELPWPDRPAWPSRPGPSTNLQHRQKKSSEPQE
jgi:hypothetical protein